MDKILGTYNYGICLFSLEILQDFLKKEKIRSKKLLDKFQKDKELYLATQKEGIWLPIVRINSGNYVIKLEGYDKPFDDEWELKLAYDGFNMEIKDSLCISDTGAFYTFHADDFSEYEHSYQSLDGETTYSAYKYDVPSGKYLVSIKGYARKQSSENYDIPNYGFLFSLIKVEAFDGFKNPRESELYEFNIDWLTKSKEAVIYWFSEAEGGKAEPPAKEDYTSVIQLEEGKTCYLHIKFDRKDPAQDKMTDTGRVRILFNDSLNHLLSSNAEYTIYEESRKRGKSIYQKVGRIVIK